MKNFITSVCNWNSLRYDQIENKPLNIALLTEEFLEFINKNDTIDLIDALVDMMYINIGAIYKMGYSADEIYSNPLHPYTRGLMRFIPGHSNDDQKSRLEAIPGVVPSLLALPKGCKFNDRCRHAEQRCFQKEPKLMKSEKNHPKKGHMVRCWLYE